MDDAEGILLPADPLSEVNLAQLDSNSDLAINNERIKMGEIYQIQGKDYALVCVHCLHEFKHFTEFIVHVEEHLMQKYEQSKGLQKLLDLGSSDICKLENTDEKLIIKNEVMDTQYDEIDVDTESDFHDSGSNIHDEKVYVMAEENHICEHCGLIYDTAKKLFLHLNKHKNVLCPICKKKFRFIRYVREHIRRFHKRKYTMDMIINGQKNILSDRDEENNENSGNDSTKLLQLPSSSLVDPLLDPNIYKENVDYKKIRNNVYHECLTCRKIIREKQKMLMHIHLHKGPEKTVSCPICNQKFVFVNYVQKHILRRHKLKYTKKMVRDAQKPISGDDSAVCNNFDVMDEEDETY